MSIDSEVVYDTVTYIRRNKIIWSISGPFTGDMVAGIVTGLTALTQGTINYSIQITSQNNILEYYNRRTYNICLANYYIGFDSYVNIVNRNPMDAPHGIASTTFVNNSILHPRHNQTGWWIKYDMSVDELYSFQSNDFVQGFIHVCNVFNLDFRDYIVGPPFKYDPITRQYIFESIEGYDIEPIPSPKKPAPIGAYYSGTYEADAEDYE